MSRKVGIRTAECLPELVSSPTSFARSIVGLGTEKRDRRYHEWSNQNTLSGCVREHVLGYRFELSRSEVIWASLAETFLVGEAVHWFLQNDPRVFGDKLVGYWKCHACGNRVFGTRPKEESCSQCGALIEATFYDEFWTKVIRDDMAFNGRIDGFFKMDERGKKLYIGEYKTIEGNAWQELTAPLMDHVFQLHCYLIFAPLAGFPEPLHDNRGIILYVSKSHQRDYPVKAFWVNRDKDLSDLIVARATEARKYIKSGKGFPKPLDNCIDTDWRGSSSVSCPAAKKCQEIWRKKVQ